MAAKNVPVVNGSFPMIIQTSNNRNRHIIDDPKGLPVGHAFTVLVTSPLTMEKVMQALNKLEQSIISDNV